MIFKKVFESLLALAIGVAIAYGLLCLYAAFLGDHFLFASVPSTYKFSPEVTLVQSRLGHTIPLLHLPNAAARYTILYSHGNLEDLGFIRPRLEVFRRHGFSVLAYDYPGFGIATGEKSEDACFAAADAAYRHLTQTLHVPPSQIILYGRSMGGGPNAYLAAKHRVAGVVMHSTFVSAYRVQTGIRALWWDRFENLATVPHIRAPLLFIHGLSDETIPVWHTQVMLEAAQKARIPTMSLLVPLALHNNVIEIARDDYWETLNNFIATLDARPAPSPAPPAPAAPITSLPEPKPANPPQK